VALNKIDQPLDCHTASADVPGPLLLFFQRSSIAFDLIKLLHQAHAIFGISVVMKQTQEIWLESSSLPTGVRSPQQWLQAVNFLRTHCSICSFKQGWVWWVANLI
jgi:hypothetical protein